MEGPKVQPINFGEEDSISIVSKYRKDISAGNSYSKNNNLKVTTDLESNNCDDVVDEENIAVSVEVLREKAIEEKTKF